MLYEVITVLSLGLLAACAPQSAAVEPVSTLAETPMQPTQEESNSMEMDMGEMPAAPVIPAGLAFADGQEIRFIHTEVSDPDVAGLLSDMMSSPVIHVPSLADAPESMLAKVYVS